MKVAEIKISYCSQVNISEAPKIKSSADAYLVAMSNWNLEEMQLREYFKVMMLNRSNKVMGIFEVSKGGVSGTVVDAKLIFAAALNCVASSIILLHNHPSGNLKPSRPDLEITQKLKQAGEFMEITVLDHLILAPGGCFYSFADEGIL